jgi:hypothetical protein
MFHKFDIDGLHMAIVYMPASITEIDRKRKGRDATNCQKSLLSSLFFTANRLLFRLSSVFVVLTQSVSRCAQAAPEKIVSRRSMVK